MTEEEEAAAVAGEKERKAEKQAYYDELQESVG
jgi:hypothetical protein